MQVLGIEVWSDALPDRTQSFLCLLSFKQLLVPCIAMHHRFCQIDLIEPI